MSEYGMRFAMPLGEPGTTGDLAARLTLRDLTVSEALWSMVDPAVFCRATPQRSTSTSPPRPPPKPI